MVRTIVVAGALTLAAILALRLVDYFYGGPTSRTETIVLVAGGVILALYFRAREAKRGGR
jgi:hypothetical protein